MKTKDKFKNLQKPSYVLVAGGLSFIGFHLVKALLRKKCFVYCLDAVDKNKQKRLRWFEDEKNFRFIDFSKKNPLQKIAVKDISYIFYLANKQGIGKIEDFLNYAKQQRAKFLLSINFDEQDNLQQKTADFLETFDLDVRIVSLSFVYGPEKDFQEDDIGRLFDNYRKRTTFKIPGDGAKEVFPVYIDDAVDAVLRAIFVQGTKGKNFLIAGRKTSILEFAQVVKRKSGSTLGIEFKEETERKEQISEKILKETKKQLNWKIKNNFEDGVSKTLKWIRMSSLPLEKKEKNSFLKKGAKLFGLKFLIGFSILFIIFVLCFGIIRFYSLKSVRKLKRVNNALKNFQVNILEKETDQALQISTFGKKTLIHTQPVFAFLGLQDTSNSFFLGFDFYEKTIRISQWAYRTVNTLNSFLKIVFKQNEGDPSLTLQNLDFYLNQLWNQLNELQAGKTEEEMKIIQEQLPFTRKDIRTAQGFVSIAPHLFSFQQRETYLILIENNFQLRPTGGVISGLGFLTFEKGSLVDFKFESLDSFTERIVGEQEKKANPPQPLQRFLGLKEWNFKDYNWDPHFPETVLDIDWFLRNVVKKDVSGFLVVNYNALQELVEEVGGVHVDEDFVSEKNLNQYLLSSDSLDISLFEKTLQRIKGFEKVQWLSLIKTIEEEMNKKNILAFFKDSQIETFFSDQGWTGALRETEGKSSLVTDYLMIVEANLSNNNSNYYLDRKIETEIDFQENGLIKEKVIVEYQNNSQQQEGDYRNYLRFYLPLELEFKGLWIGDKKITDFAVDFSQKHGKQVVGIFVDIPAGEKEKVTISYQRSQSFSFESGSQGYGFYFQKQPGMKKTPFLMTLKYPADWEIERSNPEGEAENGEISFESDNIKDRLFLINFKKDRNL